MSPPIKISDYFIRLGDAIANSGQDRDLTAQEQHDLQNAALELDEDESSCAVIAENQGLEMDHAAFPIGATWIAWIKSWF